MEYPEKFAQLFRAGDQNPDYLKSMWERVISDMDTYRHPLRTWVDWNGRTVEEKEKKLYDEILFYEREIEKLEKRIEKTHIRVAKLLWKSFRKDMGIPN